jgi:hypothetical protein
VIKKPLVLVVGGGIVGQFVSQILKEHGYNPLVLYSLKKIHFQGMKREFHQGIGMGGKTNYWGGWIDGDCHPIVKKFLRIKKQDISWDFKKLGFKNKNQSFWVNHRIRTQKFHVESLIIENNKVIGVQNKYKKIYADQVFLCAGPFSNFQILIESKVNKLKMQKFDNHMSSGFLGLIPKTFQKESQGYLNKKDGVVEIKGPILGHKIHKNLKPYSLYKIHYIGQLDNKAQREFCFRNNKLMIKNVWSQKDKTNSKIREMALINILIKLGVKKENIIKVQNSLNISNIAHEVADLKMKTKIKNLHIIGPSRKKTCDRTFPTASLLNHTYKQLIQTI